MKRLGAIIAGGRSTRFGGDKTEAQLNGRALLDHVADGLRDQADHLVVCGRAWPGIESLDDRPEPNLGPLGGISAALYFAQENGYSDVITAGCDVLPVPNFPANAGNPAAAYFAGQFLFGIWPASLCAALDHHLMQRSNLSMRHWIKTVGARELNSTLVFRNINSKADLSEFAAENVTAT